MTAANLKLRSTALAALMSVPLVTGAALAQQSQEPAQEPAQETAQSQAQVAQEGQPGAGADPTSESDETDALIATVGEAEIRSSDVMTVIGQLPPQLQSQPPQMLVPMALQQLVLRELILEEARAQNLADDPDVKALVENSASVAEEDAMVQVWLDREFQGVVTDEAVQGVYEDLQAKAEAELPAMEELRPQIEQHLRQQAMQGIQARLRQDAAIVLYGPGGEPLDPQPGAGNQQGGGADDGGAESSGDQAQGTPSSGQSGTDAADQPDDTTDDTTEGD